MSKRSWSELLGFVINAGRGSLSRFWRFEARLKGCQLGPGVVFLGRPLIGLARGSRIALGTNVRVNSAVRANPLGCFQPSVLRTLCSEAEIVLETGVGLSATVLCAAASIRIGEGTIMGAGAMILDTDFHRPAESWNWGTEPERSAKPICIGRGVFIGARAIILKGVTIGDRAIIGAGSVVTRDVPPYHTAVGNPSRIVAPKQPPNR